MERNCKCACSLNSVQTVTNIGVKGPTPRNHVTLNEGDVVPSTSTNEVTSSPTHSKEGISPRGRILFHLITTNSIPLSPIRPFLVAF